MTLSTETRAEIELALADFDKAHKATNENDELYFFDEAERRLRRLLQQETSGPDRQAIEKAFWLWWRSPDADQFKSGIWSPVENAFMAWKAANGLLTVGEPAAAQPQ